MGQGEVAWVYPGRGHSVNQNSGIDYGHPSHRGFQEKIDADPLLFPPTDPNIFSGTFIESFLAARRFEIPKYDVYVLENVEALFTTPYIRKQHPDSVIVLLAAHRVFGLESYNFEDDSIVKSLVRPVERYCDAKLLRLLIRRYVDGILTISEFVSEYISAFTGDISRRTVYPYIQPDFESQLEVVNSEVLGTHAITVCEARDHKGVDMLVEAWPGVRDVHPQATLGIIGDGHPSEYQEVPGVSVHGFVDDLAAEYERADLYVHPARADAFGVTVLEAMRAGTPPLVTNMTGSRGVVSKISTDLVVDPTVMDLAVGVSAYFELDEESRSRLSERATELSGKFTSKQQREHFAESYDDLLNNIVGK